jgi:hypothetical protein
MSDLKPIETKYKGILFRSRIEARWALFYDKIKVPWEYEKEGYDLNGVLYLPDFWMPQQDCFIEIKGDKPNVKARDKAQLLSMVADKNVFLFSGGLPPAGFYAMLDRWELNEEQYSICYFPDGCFSGPYLWCLNLHTGLYEIRSDTEIIPNYNSATDSLVYAYNAARSARF